MERIAVGVYPLLGPGAGMDGQRQPRVQPAGHDGYTGFNGGHGKPSDGEGGTPDAPREQETEPARKSLGECNIGKLAATAGFV